MGLEIGGGEHSQGIGGGGQAQVAFCNHLPDAQGELHQQAAVHQFPMGQIGDGSGHGGTLNDAADAPFFHGGRLKAHQLPGDAGFWRCQAGCMEGLPPKGVINLENEAVIVVVLTRMDLARGEEKELAGVQLVPAAVHMVQGLSALHQNVLVVWMRVDHRLEHLLLTGRSALPTKQSLGYCASTMYYAELEENCDEEIYRVIDKHRAEGIPIDNFWLASGYTSGEGDNLRYVFNWNLRRFPKPAEFFARMNEMGINVIPNLKPGILKNHPYRTLFEANKVFIKNAQGDGDYYGRWWGGEGRFFDFTGQAGRSTWKELLKKNVLELGVKTVWNDNCEMDGVEDRDALCDFEGEGGTMAQLKIMHSNLMAYVGKQALAEVYPGERPYIINRAGFAGIQRYAQVWGGDNLTDWRTVKFNIPTIVGMGLSGCANMGCDIGGFHGGAPEAELMLRWIQSGVFQPRFCMNSANDDNTVTQPWMYPEMNEYVRAAYRLRYQMLPYLYSLMYQANQSGAPAMRPLFWEFPQDEACYRDQNITFMFGPAVLVANVVEKGAKERTLYLPKGCTWYDMNDNLRAYEGGQTITVPVTLGSIPMFLRGSAVFVTTDDVQHIECDTVKSLNLLVSAQRDNSFVLYDDDGHSEAHRDGVYCRTNIEVQAGDRTVIKFRREGSYQDTVERMNLRLVSKEKGAYWVHVNGTPVMRTLVKEVFDQADCAWYYDLSDRTIWVKYPNPAQREYEVVISTEKFDLVGMVLEDK